MSAGGGSNLHAALFRTRTDQTGEHFGSNSGAEEVEVMQQQPSCSREELKIEDDLLGLLS